MKPEYSKELLAEMWKKLNLAREFETRVQWLFSMGLVHGTTHLGIGEEATAVGSILALKPQDYVFGTHRGACFEALNLAALWKLPILFVCINNTYGMSTPIAKAMHDTDLSKRAYPFGIPSKTVDGNHVLEVYDAVSEAREYVLENGPMMVVENTYRISGHSKSDGNLYRSKEEINAWKEKCPIKAVRSYLAERRLFTEEELDAAVKEAAAVIDHAVEYGKASKNPSVDDVFDDVYA